MGQMDLSRERVLYFPQRITETMGRILDYPLTIVEAPIGYGKTTAVREHVLRTGAALLWQNVYYDSRAAFWSGFCLLIGALDRGRVDRLLKLGFPDDSVSLQAVLNLIEGIAFPERTCIVIDDFHYVDSQEVASFITLMAVHRIENLSIVLISRFYQFFDTQELSLKHFLYHIRKESFEFSQREIIVYYQSCGIAITPDEAEQLYGMTEGWISALYLLMLNFRESGSLLTSIDIHKLIEQAVYDPFPNEIKRFLLSMSIFNNFTQEQAGYMMAGVDTDEIMGEVTGSNAFITYDPIQRSYHMHSLFKHFLTNELKTMPEAFQGELYGRAAHWCIRMFDYLPAMRFAYMGKDFDTLLHAMELDRGRSINGEHKAALMKYFGGCSMEQKQRHPYAVLIYDCRMFMFNEVALFNESCEAFMSIYRHNESDDEVYRHSLLGEYELLMSFSQFNDIKRMSECYMHASELMSAPSLILDYQSSWTYGSPSVLHLFYRESGELAQEVRMMQEVIPHYCRITGNHGKGADEIMDAERFYYMGDFVNAEIAMHRAYQAAADTSDILLCTIFLHIKLCFVKGDYGGITALFKQLRDNIFENKWHMLIHTIDICEAYIYACLHMNDRIAPWIRAGTFRNTRLVFPALSYLNIVYGRVLIENREYTKLLGRADSFMDMANVYPNLLARIYTLIYITAANARLGRSDDALAALVQALDIAVPDRIYMPFVENGERILPMLEDLHVRNRYRDDIARILPLYREYSEAERRIRTENSAQCKLTLTQREGELARLIALGLSNKEIGKCLYISENTVKTQLKSIFRKLGITSRQLLKQELDLYTIPPVSDAQHRPGRVNRGRDRDHQIALKEERPP